jgi:flagellar L-ring protein FlgH
MTFGVLVFSAAWPCVADEAQTLFDEQSYRSLVAEHKAKRVGDLLTVILQESATATSSTDLKAQRDFSVGSKLDLTGFPSKVTGQRSAAVGTSTESDGTGSTQRSGHLLAQLSARVLHVTPEGDLVVSGQQSLTINGEEQLITLSGVVRPQDIGADNTVLSNRIAQARIHFDGQGFVTEQSRPGWLARFFSFLGM